jgi:nitrogen-specific signal transduction histidine kinase
MAGLAIVAYRLLEAQRVRIQHDRVALEAQLLEARKMEAVGRLAGGIAHDFNNLLTAIGGYNDLALDSLPPDDPIRELLLEVRSATNRAASVTKQLLAFARRQIVKPTDVDVNAVLADLQRMMRPLIGEHIFVDARLEGRLRRALVDRGQLEQVLLNLSLNARDAMPSGGTLTLATTNVLVTAATRPPGTTLPDGEYVSILVGDTGTGIPEADLPHIFEPFFTTKGRENGTGLGLATVYGILAQSGGAITVATRIGNGTTFTVYLPAARAAAGRNRSDRGGRPVAGGRETVLIAEDEAAVRVLARRSLEQRGYQVLEAATPRDALRIAVEHAGPIHLLLTDVVMPELSGPEVAERVQAARNGIKVLFMSGYADAISARHLADERRELLHKPFTPEKLAARVRRVLDARGGVAATGTAGFGANGPGTGHSAT